MLISLGDSYENKYYLLEKDLLLTSYITTALLFFFIGSK